MASKSTEQAVATEGKVVIEDSNGTPVPEILPGGLTSTGQYTSPFRVINPPLDKKLHCITDYDMKIGTFHGWSIYTPEDYARDRDAYNTLIPSNPDFSDGKVRVASHWYVYLPIETWRRVEAAKATRVSAGAEAQGKISHVDKRHEGTVKITTSFHKSHDGLPG